MKLLLRLSAILLRTNNHLQISKQAGFPAHGCSVLLIIASLFVTTLCGCLLEYDLEDDSKVSSHDTLDAVDDGNDSNPTSTDSEAVSPPSDSDTHVTDTDTSEPEDTNEPEDSSEPEDTSPEETITITHSASQGVLEHNSIACITEDDGPHLENSYYRVFDLADFGITSDFEITKVELGIQKARAGFLGLQPATLKLYTLSGPLTKLSNLRLLRKANVLIKDKTTAIERIAIRATAPAGSTLVVEFYMPDGSDNESVLRIGSNGGGETGSTYVMSRDCDIDTPTLISDAMKNPPYEVHWVMNVIGTHVP